MNIFKFLNKLLTKKSPEIDPTPSLARLNDIIPLPKKEDYLKSPAKLDLITKYKNEYLSLLRQNKTLTSIELMPEYLHEYKNIYTDLLLNLCLEDNSDISFLCIHDTGNPAIDEFKFEITRLKLILYQESVASLEESARLRLVALIEILDNFQTSNIFSKLKNQELINAILNEINNLHSCLLTFTNQRLANYLEAENYLKKLDITSNKSITNDESLISKTLSELKYTLNLIDPAELKKIENLNLAPKLFIAVIEQKLEIYVYTHLNVLNNLSSQVQEINSTVNTFMAHTYGLNITSSIFEKERIELLSEVKNLELLYKIFSTYGRNLVSKSDLQKLYNIKFKLLTKNILNEDKFDILENITFTELECFQNIIYQKIEEILKGENSYLTELASSPYFLKSKIPEIIKDIISVIKNGAKEFSPWNILQNKKLLSFILTLENHHSLTGFFRKIKCSRNDYFHLNYYDKYFDWTDMLPLDTIFRIMTCNLKTNTHEVVIEPLYRLYLINEYFNNNQATYTLPEGLLHINIPLGSEFDSHASVIKYIEEKAAKKTVIMPSTLKSMSGNLFYKAEVNEIILNENLKEVGEYALLIPELTALTFTSPLISISPNAFVFKQLKQITYNYPLEDTDLENIINQLVECFDAFASNKIEQYLVPEHIKEQQRLYDEGRFSSSDHAYLFMHDTVYQKYKLTPSFDELTFVNHLGEKIKFTKEDLTYIHERSQLGTSWHEKKKREDMLLSAYEKHLVCSNLKEKLSLVIAKEEANNLKLNHK